jgi:hypothetical protein
LTTSVVDDVFYIVKLCIQRGLSTRDPDCFCALINSIGNCLELDYMVKLQHSLSESFKGDNTVQGTPKLIVMYLLNNIDTSCEYIMRLCGDLENELNVFTGDLQIEQIKASLSTLTDYAQKSRDILQTWLENFFKQGVKSRIRNLVMILMMEEKYILSQQEYEVHSRQEMLSTSMFKQFKIIVKKIESRMTQRNQECVIGLSMDLMMKELETKIRMMKFNYLGGFLLDLQLRNIIATFLEFKSRERMKRLVQVSMILNFESVKDFKDVELRWISGQDVKKILAQRVEFSQDEILELEV